MVRDLIICGLAALEVEEEGKAVRKYVIKRSFHYEVGIPIKNPKSVLFGTALTFNKLSLILIQLGHKIKSEVIFFLVNLPIPRMHPKKYTFCDRGGKEMAAELYPHNEEETRRSYA